MTNKLIPTSHIQQESHLTWADTLTKLKEAGIKPVYSIPQAGGKVRQLWDPKDVQPFITAHAAAYFQRKADALNPPVGTMPAAAPAVEAKVDAFLASKVDVIAQIVMELLSNQLRDSAVLQQILDAMTAPEPGLPGESSPQQPGATQ